MYALLLKFDRIPKFYTTSFEELIIQIRHAKA